MKEIVGIQIGNSANFIGSHFWNFQDELLGLADSPDSDQVFKNHGFNMDVLYRTGETQLGILTYTPRLVSVGFQGSLGSVSSRGTLYSVSPATSRDSVTWTGSITTQASEPLVKNLFLQSLYKEENDESVSTSRSCDTMDHESHAGNWDKNIVECLENEVRCWTDFSKVDYHPQSLYELNGLWLDPDDFNNYGIGREAFSTGLNGEEINERLRFFVEECDLIQGFQFTVDYSGGFSGVAGEFLENIADEYTNIPVLLYAVGNPDSRMDSKSRKLTVSRKLNDTVSFAKLSAFCKLIVPVGLPSLSTSKSVRHLCINDKKPYHTSAVYASAINSISLPFRMQPPGPNTQLNYTSGAIDVNEVVQLLGDQSRQNMVATLDVAMPAPSLHGNLSFLENMCPLSPGMADDTDDIHAVESMTLHGLFKSDCLRASASEVNDAVQAAYLNAVGRPKFSHLSVAQCPLPIPLPFPLLFGNLVNHNGELLADPIPGSASRGPLEVHSIPMAARLRSSNAVLPFLEERLGDLRMFGTARGAIGTEVLRRWGFGKDEVDEMGETLYKMVTALSPATHESPSDSDY